MLENIRLSFRGIFSHKLRSFLTMLGIIIGIAAIIAIVSTIKGTNEQIKKNLIGSGQNNVDVQLYQGDWEYEYYNGLPAGIPVLDEENRQKLAAVDHVERASFYRKRSEYDAVFYLNHSLSGGYVFGIDKDYFPAAGLTVKRGRGISTYDIAGFRKVCVLDENSASTLFAGDDPLGKTVEIKSQPFTVIGIITESEKFEPTINSMEDYMTYRQDISGRVYVPESIWPLIYQYDEPQNVLLQADSTEAMTQIGKEAEQILNEKISTSEDGVRYKAKDLLKQAEDIEQLSRSTNTMLLWIAAISLLVGGIGVMNIMLVSVTERTSEIGLKKAVGADKKAILLQFLTEAVVLTSSGGVIGVISGILLAELISKLNGTPVAISIQAAVFAVLFSMVIGIVFGLLPSYKAANLDPIEALRHE